MAVHLQYTVRAGNTRRFKFRTATRPLLVLLIIFFGLSYLSSSKVVAAVYYVSNAGCDSNDGKSVETAWRTIARVNAEPFKPGDVILFRRADCWREQLIPHSGDENGSITYAAYGSGNKPLLLGSVKKNAQEDWHHEHGNIWATTRPVFTEEELVNNLSASRWSLKNCKPL